MDISKLFLWSTEHVVKDDNDFPVRDGEGDPVIVYIRVIGDNDIDRAKKYALRESKKLREEYRHIADEIFPDMFDLSKEELASLITLNEAGDIYKEKERSVTISYPKAPKEVTLESEEIYLEEVDSYFDRLAEKINNEVEKEIITRRKYYIDKPKDYLVEKAKRSYLNRIVEREMVKFYNDAVLYFSAFKDKDFSERVFDSIESAGNSSTTLKSQLMATYTNLTLKGTELKK